MAPTSRRTFLQSVGSGMLVAGLGTGLVQDLGFSTAFANEGPESLKFGKYDGLVDLMQSTPPDKLQALLIEKLNCGEADLQQLTIAAALANAETFGGEDYVGFHTAMAMLPAWGMAECLPVDRRAAAGAEGALSQLAADSAVRRRRQEDAPRAARRRGSDRRERRHCNPRRLPRGRRRDRREAVLGIRARRHWKTPSTPCSRRCRTTSTCIASCSPIAPTAWRTCSARSTPTRSCGSACGSASITRRTASSSKRRRVADPRPDAEAARPVQAGRQDTRQARSGRCGRRRIGPHDLSRARRQVGRSGRRGTGRRDRPGGRRRSDFAGVEHARAAAGAGQSGGPTAIRPASTRPTRRTPCATWPATAIQSSPPAA